MKKKYTYIQVIEKAELYCASQERCIQEVLKKCYDWQLEKELHDQIIQHLLNGNYINEERYAFAYVRSKFNFKGRGKNKILYELKGKKIDPDIIENAMLQIESHDYNEKIIKLITVKLRSYKKYDFHQKKLKLIQFLMQKGYEYDVIKSVLTEQEPLLRE